jgi:hypothetical protein
MIAVKDGNRTLYVDGELLADSTSYRRGSTRWIEFRLYKTVNGQYVLSRVGVSIVYHGAACELVTNYNLQETSQENLELSSVPCEKCCPDDSINLIFPEKNRYWAQVSEQASAVLDALYKYDDGGARYLTNVAQRLLEDAAKKDKDIANVYRFEIIE